MMSEAELARRIGVSVRTLQRYRAANVGPAWSRFGPGRGTVRYAEADVAAWRAATRAGPEKS